MADTALRTIPIAIAVLLLGTVFWPWAGAAPLTRPFVALLGVAGYPWEGYVLYRGSEHLSTGLPWHYAPWWFLITMPPAVLAGVALSLVVLPNRADVRRKAVLWGIALIPITAAIVRGSTLYDGVRHLLFVYPVLVVLAAAGWAGVVSWSGAPLQRGLVRTALAVLIISALVSILRLHPNQVTYFNALVGGPNGAFKRYDLDYWGNCMLQAVEWGAEKARSAGVTVTMSGEPHHLVQQNAERYPEVVYVPEEWGTHQLYVRLARGTRSQLRRVIAGGALHEVTTRDGALLCIVRAGPALDEFGQAPGGARSRESTGPSK